MADFSLLFLSVSSHLYFDFVTFGSPHLPTWKAFYVCQIFYIAFPRTWRKQLLKNNFHAFQPNSFFFLTNFVPYIVITVTYKHK